MLSLLWNSLLPVFLGSCLFFSLKTHLKSDLLRGMSHFVCTLSNNSIHSSNSNTHHIDKIHYQVLRALTMRGSTPQKSCKGLPLPQVYKCSI